MSYSLFKLAETDRDADSDSDSKPDGYIVSYINFHTARECN